MLVPDPRPAVICLEKDDCTRIADAGEESTLRPVRGTRALTKEHGVRVFYGGAAPARLRNG